MIVGCGMFGYVRVYQPELKMGEFEQYRGVYCSLCKSLGKRYGFFARMTLSYDFTFLAVFHMALQKGCAGFRMGRCALNPLKKRMCCRENEEIAYAADAAVLLLYHKLRDTVADSGLLKGLGARFLLLFISRAKKKAAAVQPELDRVVTACMEQQAALEKAQTTSIDAAAEPSARMLAAMAAAAGRDDRERLVLDRFGYCLGRWIYLIDAVDDMAEDLEAEGYNPYLLARGIHKGEGAEQAIREAREYSRLTLNACLAECIAAYNLLDIRHFDGILRNVLEWGMPAAQERVIQGQYHKEKRDPAVLPSEEKEDQGKIAGKV